MAGLEWLSSRPIAHRGLHAADYGVVENTATAFAQAIAGGYAIECDVQVSADGEAMVYHDATLGRLTQEQGALASLSAQQLGRIALKATADRILTLGELCDLVAGRVTLVIEMKSAFDANAALPRRVAGILQSYAGPVAAMSFDPRMLSALAQAAPGLPRGIVAEGRYDHADWGAMSVWQKFALAHLLHAVRTRPHFVAYNVKHLPAAAPLIARHLFGMPLLTWTVRSEADRRKARLWANQMIFEGFRP